MDAVYCNGAINKVDPVLGDASKTLIGLIDRVRMLDNDMIRLTQKLNMVLEFKEQYEKGYWKKLDWDLECYWEADAIKKQNKSYRNLWS